MADRAEEEAVVGAVAVEIEVIPVLIYQALGKIRMKPVKDNRNKSPLDPSEKGADDAGTRQNLTNPTQ